MSVQEQPTTETDFSGGAGWADGHYLPVAEIAVPILDHGFLKCDACYDTPHVWRGLFFRLDDHLDRFEASCRGLGLDPGLSREAIREIMLTCAKMTGQRELMVQIVCTRGLPDPAAPRDPRRNRNRFFCFTRKLDEISSDDAGGAHIHISDVPRIPPESVDPRLKNFHRGDMTRALMAAHDAGADTTVLVDQAGNITEGPGFNVFAVKEGRLTTPETGTLEGVTRLSVLELAQELGLPAAEGTVTPDDLREADEVFLTSTAGGVMAATRVDDRILSNGAPGPTTVRLRDLYWEKKAAGWYGTAVPYDD
ncbi:MAG: aminotransferase class IV [Alphaproteobacteria bacterium]|jgi:branched-chain amino acid aminotransferase|nr:aminotransferase class IV [Alphaproteobacteria bacterium]